MKILLLFHFLIILSSLVSADVNITPTSDLKLTFPKQRITAPDFKLPKIDDTFLTLSQYKGQVILLNFWATFCAPCREEMPAFQILWEKYHDQGLLVIAVSVDKSEKQIIQDYIQNSKITYPVVLDRSADVRKKYEVNALPITYIIGRDGKFIAKTVGMRNWDSKSSFLFIEKLLL